MSDMEKFSFIMCSEDAMTLCQLAKFVYNSFDKREMMMKGDDKVDK